MSDSMFTCKLQGVAPCDIRSFPKVFIHRLRPALVFILIILSCLQVDAQEKGCDRLGGVIDSLEREYFGLFPSIAGFKSARIASGHEGLDLIVTRRDFGGIRDTIIRLGDSTGRELCSCIGMYEDLFLHDDRKVRWSLLRGLVRPRYPFAERPLSITVVPRTGNAVTGRTLFIGDSILALLPEENDAAGWRTFGNTATIFHVSEVERIYDTRSFIEHIMSDIDIPVRGNDTVFRKGVGSAPRMMALMNGIPSPSFVMRSNGNSRASKYGVRRHPRLRSGASSGRGCSI